MVLGSAGLQTACGQHCQGLLHCKGLTHMVVSNWADVTLRQSLHMQLERTLRCLRTWADLCVVLLPVL